MFNFGADVGWNAVAAIGTVAATTLAVWQAGATTREKMRATYTSISAAWILLNEAQHYMEPEHLEVVGVSSTAAQLRSIQASLDAIPLDQLSGPSAVAAVVRARAVVGGTAEAVSAGGVDFSVQLDQLERVNRLVRDCLGRVRQPRTIRGRLRGLFNRDAGRPWPP